MNELIELARRALNLYEQHIRIMQLREDRMQEYADREKNKVFTQEKREKEMRKVEPNKEHRLSFGIIPRNPNS